MIRTNNYQLPKIENLIVPESTFDKYEIEHVGVEPILFQTGYLTIKEVIRKEFIFYKLYYPNLEVKQSLLDYLFASYIGKKPGEEIVTIVKLKNYLIEEKIDEFFKTIKGIISGIPYEILVNKEDYYNSLIYTILSLVGIECNFKLMTNIGRLDCALEFKDKVYIFEFKLNSTGQQGIKQIKEKKYYEKYLNSKKLYIVGVSIDTKIKNIKNWKYEILT